MSGGHFDYKQYELISIADKIDELIRSNNDSSIDEYGDTVGRFYSQEILLKFMKTKDMLRLTAAMVQRVDWLVSGDDGEDTFMERWEEEVEGLRK